MSEDRFKDWSVEDYKKEIRRVQSIVRRLNSTAEKLIQSRKADEARYRKNRSVQAEIETQRTRNRNQGKTKPYATLHWKKWDEIDEAYLLENNGSTLVEKALVLGRTYKAVRSKARKLREHTNA